MLSPTVLEGAPPSGLADDAARDIVRRLLRGIAGELPLAAAAEMLDENVAAYMDGKIIGRGRGAWFRWVSFLQHNAAAQFSNFGMEIESMEEDGDVVRVRAKWRGDRNGKTGFSKTGEVAYQIRSGKIVKIWTHRKNYAFIYGEKIAESRAAFWLLLLRLFLRRAPKGMEKI